MAVITEPELKTYMDKKVSVQLNGSRKVIGILRGYDIFLNVTISDALEEKPDGEKLNLGITVCEMHV
ncbi:uncharacterized protein KGF55_001856 [Candida pseudojiufengensis]|uniref:uncharacterized protein n=1 Tax=Candida pseudojiufengensis TaxID=497109 RepID=UPI0022241FDE|nr:uncharacterized protein KGF55_001856 [Candida pseudojiufengensis]KAI5964786.1 hypothetical protein KGF55_001856 [Candida pseudojiufengensis]